MIESEKSHDEKFMDSMKDLEEDMGNNLSGKEFKAVNIETLKTDLLAKSISSPEDLIEKFIESGYVKEEPKGFIRFNKGD